MELFWNNGDYVPDGAGGFERAEGQRDLLQRVLFCLTARRGMFPLDPELGSQLFRLPAKKVYALYLQSEWVRRQCFPQTAEGEMLDQHAALRGIERRAAVPSVGVIHFFASEPAAADCAIEKGTVCMTTGLVRFETTEEAVLRQGETETRVAAQAVEAGAGGNVAAGTIVRMTVPPVGISGCSNPEAFTGGLDAEEDEALRSRVLETFRRMSSWSRRSGTSLTAGCWDNPFCGRR